MKKKSNPVQQQQVNPTTQIIQPSPEELGLQKEQAELLRLQRESIEQQQAFNKMITPIMLKESGFDFDTNETGDITNIRKQAAEIDPNEQSRKDIETAFLDRTKKALAGELPVDPGLLKDLDKSDQELEDSLRKQFGDLTSTPAREALQRAKDSRNMLLDQARRGDLTLAEQLGQARQNSNQGLIDSSFNRTMAIGGSNNFASQFANAGTSAGQAMNPFQFNRTSALNVFNSQQSMRQSQQSQSNPFGAILGTVAGSFFGPIGAKVGGKVASQLFN